MAYMKGYDKETKELLANFDIINVLEVDPGYRWELNERTFPSNMTNVVMDWHTWGVKNNGTIDLVVPIVEELNIGHVLNFSPNELPDVSHLLGAIYEFYQSYITKDDAQRIKNIGAVSTDKLYTLGSVLKGSQIKYIDIMENRLAFDGIQFAIPRSTTQALGSFPEILEKGQYAVLISK